MAPVFGGGCSWLRLGIFVLDPSLGSFRLGNWAPEAGGAGLLRLGEPLQDRGGEPWGPVRFAAWPLRVRTLPGKPSQGIKV